MTLNLDAPHTFHTQKMPTPQFSFGYFKLEVRNMFTRERRQDFKFQKNGKTIYQCLEKCIVPYFQLFVSNDLFYLAFEVE